MMAPTAILSCLKNVGVRFVRIGPAIISLGSLVLLPNVAVFAQQKSQPTEAPQVEKQQKKEVAKTTTLSAAGLSSGAGGGLPGVEGRVPDMAKVEASGAGSYSIQIAVPPGTAGIQPNLALVYNSQNSNGLFGMGWSLKGLPTIHRCAAQLEPDGVRGRVGYDTADLFCLDGARLMLVSNTAYGANGAEYRTEVDSHIKIKSFGTAGSGPATFQAWTKEGRILEFGSSIFSADIQAVGRSEIRVWALNKIQDTKGNTLTISYVKDGVNGHYRPDTIAYTSNTGLAATRFVKFFPEARSDVYPLYVGGSVIKTTERIKHIKTYVGGTDQANVVKHYELGYADEATTTTRRSRLISIKECNKNGVCLPAETSNSIAFSISYQNGGNNTLETRTFNISNAQINTESYLGDYNGDGKTDLASWKQGNLWVHLSDGTGFNYTPVSTPVPTSEFSVTWTWAGDVNGDGRTDIVAFENGKLFTYLAKSNGTGQFEPKIIADVAASKFVRERAWSADINGDGRMDLVSRNNSRLWTYISGFWGTNGNFPLNPPEFPMPDSTWDNSAVWTGDYNGDGMQDLLTFKNGRLWAHLSNGTGTGWTSVQTDISGSQFSIMKAWSGDFNGDGLTDIASYENGLIYTYLCKGDGTFLKDNIAFNPSNPTFDGLNVWAIDVNGDGRTDLISWQLGNLHTLYSKGDTTYFSVSNNTPPNTVDTDNDNTWAGDATGDGKGDLLSYKNDQLHTHVAHTNSATDRFPDLVVAIDNMFGGRNALSYKPLSDGAPFYVKDPDPPPANPPAKVSLQYPLYVVANMTASDADNNYNFNYSYAGALAHIRGRGFLGFRTVDMVDVSANAATTRFYFQDFPLTGTVNITQIEDLQCPGQDNLRLDTRDTYDTSTDPFPGKGVKRNLLVQTDKNEYECSATPRFSKTTFLYDSNANLIKNMREGVAGTSDDQIEETEWANNGDWLFRPKTQRLKDATGTILRQKWLFYDKALYGNLTGPGLLTKEEHDSGSGAIGGANNSIFEYDHDPLTGVENFVQDPRLCETTIVLDSTKTFPNEIRTCANEPALNFLMTNTFDARFGIKTFERDWNGQETRVQVDDFGRVSKMTNMKDYLAGSPNGTEKYEYLQWGVANAQRITILKTIEHGGSAVLKTDHFIDGFGRVDQTQSDGPAGETILEQAKFDSRNRIAEIFAPRFLTEPVLASRKYQYDALDRQTKVIHPDGRQATSAYSPGVVTIIDERGKTKLHFVDAFGRLSQVREFNLGTPYNTYYNYDSANQLIQVQNAQNHLTKLEYDRLGRKTAMCDPNMGTHPTALGTCTATGSPTPGAWLYTYNQASDMLTQIDAKGQKLCFEYDKLGRVRFKKQGASCANVLATFTYDNTSISGLDFPKGNLTEVIDHSSNVTTRFAYDELGRMPRSQRVLLGITREMFQTYDALNRIKQETFPDFDTISYIYDGPWLKSVGGYIDNILYNGRGQKKTVAYFNTVQTTFTYYDQPGDTLKNFRVKRRVTTNFLQDLQYTYDAASNLTSITDNIWTATRSVLAYDDLNRLTQATGTFGPLSNNLPTPASCAYEYNSIGNLTNKCGNAFAYNHPMHPSAVTAAIGKNYDYDANGNMTARGTQTLEWDFENRVTRVSIGASSTTMEYDYTGMRVKKFAPGATTPTQYPFPGYEIDPDGTINKFIMIGNESFASKKTPPSGQGLPSKHYYHNDHLGGVNILSSEVGAKEQLTEYDPWGQVSRNEGSSPGSQPTVDKTHRFTGQELDPETGLYYYGGRYYDHEISRFVSPDPYVQESDDPQNLNRYSYVLNNPADYVDPTGFFFESLFSSLANTWASLAAAFEAFFTAPAPVADAAAVQANAGAIKEATTIKQSLQQKWEHFNAVCVEDTCTPTNRVRLQNEIIDELKKFAHLAAQNPKSGLNFVDAVPQSAHGRAAIAGAGLDSGGDAFGSFRGMSPLLPATVNLRRAANQGASQRTGQLQTNSAALTPEPSIRIRHYTNAQGLRGIREEGVIRAHDKGRVFAEAATRKPLSARIAEKFYGLKVGRGRHYVETNVPADRVEIVKNPRTKVNELRIKGDVVLDNATFHSR